MLSYSRGDLDGDVIFALATPRGLSSIAVIRISGRGAEQIVRNLAPGLRSKIESHHCYRVSIMDQSRLLDDAVLSYFGEGKSYTGECVFEISCHGNMTITDRVCQLLSETGARAALPGEFTFRAVMNGKMDLVQAESVLGIIHAQGSESVAINLRNLSGYLSGIIREIKDQVLWCLAHLESSIDFSEEDLGRADYSAIRQKIEKLIFQAGTLSDSYHAQKFVQEGFRVVLLGRPNAGKSSLFNALVGRERSIVSPIAGTTRDLIESQYIVDGIPVVFQDTAGLALATEDEIEAMGIARGLAAAAEADFCILVLDGTSDKNYIDLEEFLGMGLRNVAVVVTKSDLCDRNKLNHFIGTLPDDLVGKCVSSVTAEGITELEELIRVKVKRGIEGQHSGVVTSRQYECLSMILNGLDSARKAIDSMESEELVGLGLMEALLALQSLTGERFEDQVMDRVFKEFCVGK